MVTYKPVTKVVRNRCVNYQAKRVDSKATLHLIETCWCFNNLDYQMNKHKLLIKQTNKTNKTVHISSSFSIFLATEE